MRRFLLYLLTFLVLFCALPAQAEDNTFTFDRTVTTLYAGETFQTTLTRSGDAADGTVTYTSSAEKNATVDENGLVTGLRRGSTTITARLKTATRSYRATITLTILQHVESISINEEPLTVFAPDDPAIASLLAAPVSTRVLMLSAGTNASYRATLEPANANDRSFEVTSSDPSVLTVSRTTFKPLTPGECDVTLTSKQDPDVTLSYHIIVIQPIKKISLSAEKTTVLVDETTQLNAEITPENATYPAVTWSSANEQIATVDENGVVTGVKKGSVTLKANAADGSGRAATIRVSVAQQPTGMTMSADSLTLNVGTSKRITATVTPANANDRSVLWTSSDDSIASVNEYGNIKPIAPGTCTITATSSVTGDVSAACTVTVHRLAEKIAFTDSSVTVSVGSTCQVFWSVSPTDTTDPSVTLKSSNTKIATVDASGVITPVKRGTCTITATANDGSKRRASIKVNVLQPVYGVHMYSDLYRVDVDGSSTLRAVLEPSDASNNHMTWSSSDTSIASVRGTNNRPTVTGYRWGDVTITGTTEDGGYTTSTTVKVGNFDRALRITDLYLEDNRIKITVENVSNMNITRFYYTITCLDMYGSPIPMTSFGTNVIEGSYGYTLYEGDTTSHGRFTFEDFIQPSVPIGSIEMSIYEYRTDEGYVREISADNRPTKSYQMLYYAPLVTNGEDLT